MMLLCDTKKTSLLHELSDSIPTIALEEFDDDLDMSTCSSSPIVSVGRDELHSIRLLGRGKYCNVHLVARTLPMLSQKSTSAKVNQRDQKALYACKSIDPTCVSSPDEWILAASDLANEAKILSDLDHKNIIKLRFLCSERFSESFGCDNSFFQRHKSKTNNSINGGLERSSLVIDVLTETLADRLKRWRKSECWDMNLNESNLLRSITAMYERIKDVLLGIARGMEYLSSQNIVHRDLKPANIGFDDEGVKLFDFGFARNVEECVPEEICGSPRYIAPEVVAGKGYSLKVDVYSFGVLFFEVCSLEVPFKDHFDSQYNSKQSFSTLSWWKKLVKNYNRRRGKNSDTRSQQHQVVLEEFYRRVVETELRPMDHLEPTVIPCPLIRSLIEECWHTDAEKRPTFQEIVSRLEDMLSSRE